MALKPDTAAFNLLADRLEARAAAFDDDTLTTMMEGMTNASIAAELRRIAAALRDGKIDEIQFLGADGKTTQTIAWDQ